MISLLFIISFIIHVVTILIVYNLSNQLRTSKNNHTKEIEQLLSTYLNEIKEENNRLQHELTEKSNQHTTPQPYKPKIQFNDNYKNENNLNTNTLQNKKDIDIVENIVEDKIESDVVETSIEARSLQLHNEGYSITEIAQKLNRGKTEVSLIIDLAKRELK